MMNPDEFETACREIVREKAGHEAHRALDLLTNDVLRSLGYGAGIDIFEASVEHWHRAAHPYPYPEPCPNCEKGDA